MKSKRNIIILILGVFILSITTVYAVAIIRAADVTYDTSKSNGSSNNVQGAIDELYGKVSNYKELLINENMISYITNLAKSDTTNLAYDDTVDKNLRYIGSNPNNYVEFNDELWRIIGVMNNVKDENGTSASRVKLIRNESIGEYSLDNMGTNGHNDWSRTRLMSILNDGVYWNRSRGLCPGKSDSQDMPCDFSNNGLTSESKSMISSTIWNLGGNGNSATTPSIFYGYERGTNVYGSNPATWTGQVGLIYPSDYGLAVGGVDRDKCLKSLFANYDINQCYRNTWLYLNTTQWTLTHNSDSKIYMFYVLDTGVPNGGYASALAVRPVIYLDTKILITKGKGTLTNPYKISFEKEIEESTSKDETKNLITKITNLAVLDTTNLVTDDTIDKNIRYIGKNPNNYIKFNDELWRIIGVMNNVKDSNGITSSRIKIIRDESIGKYSWDSSGSYGNNDWSQAKLMKTLNEGPYWNKKSGICYNGNNNQETDCDFSKIGLTDEAKSMIGNITWNLGGRSNSSALTSTFYTNERETTVYSGRPTEWNGYVGLMYPSDYGYAVGGSVRSSCLSGKLSDYNNNNCYKNDWLYLYNTTQWTLSPYSGTEMGVFYVYMSGLVSNGNAFYSVDVRPVVYLNTDIEVISGDGTIDNPYIIKKG